MFQGLSLDQAPPFKAPARFFLTAPVFAILGGILIFFSDNLANVSSPLTLAVLHFFTLGFMSMVMIGAMQQMLPVLVGVRFPNPLLFATVIHIFLSMATLMFGMGFYLQEGDYLLGAAVFLLTGIGLFAGVTLYKLFEASFKSESVTAMKFSLISLFVTLMLGVYLLLGIGTSVIGEEFEKVLKIHGFFAFFGWTGLLIAGVSYQVIPMFFITSEFNAKIKRYLALSVFISLFIFSAGVIFGYDIFALLTLTLFGIFGVFSLMLLKNRKRKLFDITINYWFSSSFSLLIGVFLFAVNIFIGNDSLGWIAGAVLGYGFAIGLINGMLYKIIPFLSWFHISSRGFFDMPTMREMIEEKNAKIQFLFHLLALISLILLPFIRMEKFAAFFIISSNSYLLYNLWQAFKIYLAYENKKSPMEEFKNFGKKL